MSEKTTSPDLASLLPLIQEVLSQGGEFELHPYGKSMLPAIREGRDTVFLSAPTEPPKRDDLLLYKRQNGTFVLHRVVRVEADGSLSMRGDNQYFLERGIQKDQVVAVVKRYFRGEREIRVDSFRARAYCARRRASFPFRRVLRGVWRRLRRLFQGGNHG